MELPEPAVGKGMLQAQTLQASIDTKPPPVNGGIEERPSSKALEHKVSAHSVLLTPVAGKP